MVSIDRHRRSRARPVRRLTKHRDFKRFHIQQAIGFKTQLSEPVSPGTGQRLSRATVFSTLSALRAFFQWLSTQPGYRSHLTSADAEYFALSDKEARIAKAIADRPVSGRIHQILGFWRRCHPAAISNCAIGRGGLHPADRRTRRCRGSLKRKHVDLVEGKVVQDAREVRTKFSKTFTTWFFPVGEDVRQIVVDWVQYLDTLQLFGRSDPYFLQP